MPKDLTDRHLQRIAKAGLALAEEVAAAHANHAAEIALANAELDMELEKRVAHFRGEVVSGPERRDQEKPPTESGGAAAGEPWKDGDTLAPPSDQGSVEREAGLEPATYGLEDQRSTS